MPVKRDAARKGPAPAASHGKSPFADGARMAMAAPRNKTAGTLRSRARIPAVWHCRAVCQPPWFGFQLLMPMGSIGCA